MTNLDSLLKSRDITLPTKVHLIKAVVFSSSHVWMWELDHKESWVLKNWYFWTVVLEKTLERPLDCKEIQPVHPKGDQSWIFIGRTDAEAETPIFWPPDMKNWLIWKDPDAGKDWRQEEKGTTEDEMVGWHHQLNGHGVWWTLEVGDGQGGQACCSLCGRKELDTTEWLNWSDQAPHTCQGNVRDTDHLVPFLGDSNLMSRAQELIFKQSFQVSLLSQQLGTVPTPSHLPSTCRKVFLASNRTDKRSG